MSRAGSAASTLHEFPAPAFFRPAGSGSKLQRNAPVRALAGWRRDVFGNDALALKHGRLALTAGRNKIELVPLPERRDAAPTRARA